MPIFTPPTAPQLPWVNAATPPLTRRLYRYYGSAEVGRSILLIDGVYRIVDTPDQLTLDGATEVYQGGHVYVVSEAVAAALTAAGFGDEVTVITWGSLETRTWGSLETWGTPSLGAS